MITGHHRTDDRSPSELAWEAVNGHIAIVEAIEEAAARHEEIRAKRAQDLEVARAQAAAASE
jgi:hypothetical protein